MHGVITPTQRTAIERHQQFRASIAAKAAELAGRKERIELAAVPVAAIEAPLVCTPQVTIIASDVDVQASSHDWFVVISDREPPRPAVRDIQKAVCEHYGVTLADMFSRRRTADIVKPRQVAMYLVKVLTLRSLPDIARRFGGRDHTTALHAIRKIPLDSRMDADLAHDLAILFETITGVQQ
jgi:hypothetical protein